MFQNISAPIWLHLSNHCHIIHVMLDHLRGHKSVRSVVHLFGGSAPQQFFMQSEALEYRIGTGRSGAHESRIADGPVPVQPLAAVGHHITACGRSHTPVAAYAPRWMRPVQLVAAIYQVLDRLVQAALRGQHQWCHEPRKLFRIDVIIRIISLNVVIWPYPIPAVASAPVSALVVGLVEFQQSIQHLEVVVRDGQQH